MFELMLERHFCAAHHLLNYVGKCATPHGHNYKVRLTLHLPEDSLDDANIAIDFGEMKKVLDPIVEELDHIDLNTHPWFAGESPSAEFMARLIYHKVAEQLKPEWVAKVCIYETDTQAVCYWC